MSGAVETEKTSGDSHIPPDGIHEITEQPVLIESTPSNRSSLRRRISLVCGSVLSLSTAFGFEVSTPKTSQAETSISVHRSANPQVESKVSAKKAYEIGAYYFSFWEPDAITNPLRATIFGNIASGEYTTADQTSPWWAGVRDFADIPPTPLASIWSSTNIGSKFSGREPLQGYYNDTLSSTLQTQIQEASKAGLSYFDFYQYWDGLKKENVLDGAIPAFESAEKNNPSDKMKFTLSLFESEDASHGFFLPENQYQMAAERIIGYMKNPNYLKTPDGRPIYSIMDTQMIGAISPTSPNSNNQATSAQVDAFIRVLDNAALKAGLAKPFIVLNIQYKNAVDKKTSDGFTCFNYGVQGEGVGPISYQSQIQDIPRSAFGKPFIQCATSDFDERPRTGLYWPGSTEVPAATTTPISTQGTLVPKASYFFETTTKAGQFGFFIKAMQQAKKNMDNQSKTELSNFLTFYSWNEWDEGGVIEPSKIDGSCYLDLIDQVFKVGSSHGSCQESQFPIPNFPIS